MLIWAPAQILFHIPSHIHYVFRETYVHIIQTVSLHAGKLDVRENFSSSGITQVCLKAEFVELELQHSFFLPQ